jgi:hypothetical protein
MGRFLRDARGRLCERVQLRLAAAEVMKSDLDVHDEVAAGFGRWRDLFERGLNAGSASRADETSR